MKSFLDEVSASLTFSDKLRSSDVAQIIIDDFSKVIIIGTGKCFHVANLAAKMADSYGLKWFAIDSGHALHGDIGIISRKDLIIYLSKSGNTEETVSCAKYLGYGLGYSSNLSVTCTEGNRLQRLCAMNEVINIKNELSVFGRAPMLSTLMMLIYLYDVINKVVKGAYKSETEYLDKHPAGAIGSANV